MRFLSTVFLALALAGCSADDGAASNAAGGLDSLRGQWVVINYWARWCKPCIEEIPELNELNASRDDVTVLGVNYDGEQGEELARQVSELDIQFDIMPQDPSAELGVPRPVVLPTTRILNPQGEIIATLMGPQTLESLSQAIAEGGPVP